MTDFLEINCVYPSPVLSTFPVGGNRSTRRKLTTFGRVLTASDVNFKATHAVFIELQQVKDSFVSWSERYRSIP
jgi:hypothetical protein